MRIAMVSLYLPGDSKIGVGYQAHAMANHLAARGHDVVVMSPDRPGESPAYEYRAGTNDRPRLVRFPWSLRKVDWSGFDVLHAHGDDWFLLGAHRPPHVRTVHGSCFVEARHIRGARERARMVAIGMGEVLATTAIADRSYGVSAATQHVYPWLDGVIPCGVELSAFAGPRTEEPDPTILFVGTDAGRKRGRLLREAFRRVVQPKLPDARLWMVCSDAPGGAGVEVLGRVSDAELAERYRRAWAFCLPSSYEGFGVPYVEALAAGCPVVATPNVGASEVLDRGRYGVLAEPTADALGQALLAMLSDPGTRDRLRAAGVVRSREYSWTAVVDGYEHVYDELVRTRQHVP